MVVLADDLATALRFERERVTGIGDRMEKAFLVWTDYEACEVFASQEDAEIFCRNQYGPDKTQWPEIDERSVKPVAQKAEKEYIAIAWWPTWMYKEAPKEPAVVSAYGKKPYVGADYGADKNTARYEGRGRTERAAERAAISLALENVPRYEYAQSSATTSGVLAVYKRADYAGRVGSDWS